MKVAFFDSGIGGLSVLHATIKRLKEIEFLYYADVENVPYGLKSRDEILKFTSDAVNFLIQQDVDAIVIACNTATSVAINDLRAKFDLPIIGMEPAVKRAIDLNSNARTLVIATPVTANGEKLKGLLRRIDTDHLTDVIALPELVKFAENEEFNGQKVCDYLQSRLEKFDFSQYSSLVLGCTHFNYFKDTLRQILPLKVALLDGIDGTINRLISETTHLNLEKNDIQNSQNIEFFYSGKKVEKQSELARIKRYLARLEEMIKIC
ncbi:glutamate racemase [Campylobacter sp. faydin G-24]|uniref:Glutamate racemase n=1 Tax=Campylobacter anatolicus TaxID=2829105 RepID=A0ABS5HIJ1_9BACT|nr:glutamate racemase [Campylobacter anatolicus]MBR8463937.1 glutamate racemase [Campylobacter anatolicus]